jgi:hypothetical protein
MHQLKENVLPLMFAVAMDVLPAQASAVPCEHIFSSSKETCTVHWSRLSPTLLEAVSARAVDELMAAGRIEELEDLLHTTSSLK